MRVMGRLSGILKALEGEGKTLVGVGKFLGGKSGVADGGPRGAARVWPPLPRLSPSSPPGRRTIGGMPTDEEIESQIAGKTLFWLRKTFC